MATFLMHLLENWKKRHPDFRNASDSIKAQSLHFSRKLTISLRVAWKLQKGTNCFLTLVNLMMKTHPAHRRPPEEVLAFLIGEQEFGVDMEKVREICGFETFERDVAEVDIDQGVVKLRGISVPIVDLRVRFDLGEPVYNESTSAIVLDIGGRLLILVVDGISDVHRLDPAQLHRAPRNTPAARSDCLIGLGIFGQHKIILIAVDKLMAVTNKAA